MALPHVTMRIARVALGWAVATCTCYAQVPEFKVPRDFDSMQLLPRMAVHATTRSSSLEPEAEWARPASGVSAGHLFELQAGAASVARVKLLLPPDSGAFIVQVPSTRVDRVRVWWRSGGGAWHASEAGDLVALHRWPIHGQFPAFAVPSAQSIDLVVVAENAGALRVPVQLWSPRSFSEGRVKQVSLSGLVMGMGLMVSVVSLLSALALRSIAAWLLFGLATWTLLTVMSLNGLLAVWVLPDWPAANDGLKVVTAQVLAGLLAWTALATLERVPHALGRNVGPSLALAALAASVAVLAFDSGSLRVPVTMGVAAVALLVCAGACVASGLKGGAQVRPVALALAMFAVAFVLGLLGPGLWRGLDVAAAASGTLVFASVLALRQAQYGRARYGRDVFGREKLDAGRDPLTALHSYQGLEQAFHESRMRAAGTGAACAMLVVYLPRMERAVEEMGFEASERALVRIAATLHRVLGREWSIGRLSKTRFGAVSSTPLGRKELVDVATQVLTQCARLDRAVDLVAEYDLRISMDSRASDSEEFVEVLRALEDNVQALADGKRIAAAVHAPAAMAL